MMQTLKLLGIAVVGYLFHDEFSHKELNPKGYYDLPIRETINGLNTDIYKGKAVKLGGYQLSKTKPQYISKIIVCDRNKDDAIKSTVRLLRLDYKFVNISPTEENAREIHRINDYLIDGCIKVIPNIRVQYEDMILDTSTTIDSVCNFLNIETDISKAVDNVEKRVVCQS